MRTNTDQTNTDQISPAEERRIARRKRLAEPRGTAFLRLVREAERAADQRDRARSSAR